MCLLLCGKGLGKAYLQGVMARHPHTFGNIASIPLHSDSEPFCWKNYDVGSIKCTKRLTPWQVLSHLPPSSRTLLLRSHSFLVWYVYKGHGLTYTPQRLAICSQHCMFWAFELRLVYWLVLFRLVLCSLKPQCLLPPSLAADLLQSLKGFTHPDFRNLVAPVDSFL